jgi:tRNA-2-methylthio-N6-dimethylallyladenosine synthase
MSKGNVYLETFGCQMNIADTERATSRLQAAGYGISTEAETADVILFNTCSVRARAEQKVFNRIGEIRKNAGGSEPVIGIMGCVAQLEGETLFGEGSGVRIVAGTRATDRLPNLIERALDGERRVLDLGERLEEEQWDVPVVGRHSPYVAYIPIVEGCNKFCTYCIVPFSRGREQSRTAAEIIDEIRKLCEAGYQEVQLIGQNVNSYRPKTEVGLEGISGATAFSRLLRAVAATKIPRIKFTTLFRRWMNTRTYAIGYICRSRQAVIAFCAPCAGDIKFPIIFRE